MKLCNRINIYRIAYVLLLMVLLSSTVRAKGPANWPQWRGPDGQGISLETGLPVEWSQTKNIKWKTPISGLGHSSPIVWNKKIFLTTALDGEVIPGRTQGVTHKLLDGTDFVHPDAVGANLKHTFKLVCLDRDTGKILWERVAYEGAVHDSRHKKASFASSTPATDGQYVFAFFGSEGLYAFDLNGKLIWKQDLGKLGTASVGYGVSPILYNELVIMQCDESGGNSFIVAFNKKSGKEAWRAARKVDVTWSTPVLVHTSKRTELVAAAAEAIISYDPAYNKGTAYVPSPILYGEYVYLMTGNGSITCLDSSTGKVQYEGARVPKATTFMASPVAFEGKLLLISEEGETFIVKAGPQHEVLRTNSIGEPVYASPAIADGKIFIRGEKNLYCIAG